MIGLANLFIYCYFGVKTTENYERMADSLYECDKPEMHVEIQKYIYLMTMNMRKPCFYHGFGVAALNLETFTTVSSI